MSHEVPCMTHAVPSMSHVVPSMPHVVPSMSNVVQSMSHVVQTMSQFKKFPPGHSASKEGKNGEKYLNHHKPIMSYLFGKLAACTLCFYTQVDKKLPFVAFFSYFLRFPGFSGVFLIFCLFLKKMPKSNICYCIFEAEEKGIETCCFLKK